MRARQTAELAAERWSGRPARAAAGSTRRSPAASARGEALELRGGVGADGRLLLVGHEPDLSRVIGELTGARADLKKGGVAVVRLEGAGGELRS